jgi:hypothetical protein
MVGLDRIVLRKKPLFAFEARVTCPIDRTFKLLPSLFPNEFVSGSATEWKVHDTESALDQIPVLTRSQSGIDFLVNSEFGSGSYFEDRILRDKWKVRKEVLIVRGCVTSRTNYG